MPRMVIAGWRVGDLEADVLRALWAAGQPVTGRELHESMARPGLGYTTLMTVLGRLVGKGLAERVKEGRVVRYGAAGDVDELTARAIGQLLESARDRQAVLAHLVEGYADPALAGELTVILERLRRR